MVLKNMIERFVMKVPFSFCEDFSRVQALYHFKIILFSDRTRGVKDNIR